jgi:hypothetical protein
MSLKSYLSPIAAFEKWLKDNPKGGIFEWDGQKVKVEKRQNCAKTSKNVHVAQFSHNFETT